LIIGAVCYVGFKLFYPYYAYMSLERTMKHWARIALLGGDTEYSQMKEKMNWTIDRHNIPLDTDDIQINYYAEEKEEVLTVYAEYDVYVELPGYTHYYHFEPYAQVTAEGN
jgi:hypothetical protein